MKHLFCFLILLITNLVTLLVADERDIKIEKKEKQLIDFFVSTCNNLIENNEIENNTWKVQNRNQNIITFINNKKKETLSVKIIKRGIHKSYRFTFKNIYGPNLFISANSDCNVNIARIIHRNQSNKISALIELSNDFQKINKVQLVNPKVPYVNPLPVGIEVALIDTGINYLLPEITSRISRKSPTEINGFDFVDNDQLPFDIDFASSSFFPRYHGTSVASILLKEAPQAVIVPYKFSRQNPCSFGEIIKKLRKTTIKVALLAMGSKKEKDWKCFLQEAQKSPDILFIVTAGNSNLNIDQQKIYPASFDLENMFVISSSTLFGNLAKGSNFGSKSVDFLVNGEQLEVFDHRGVRSITSGSSYAAPRIAAMSVRYFAKNPTANISDFKTILIKRAINNSEGLVKYGWIPDPLDNYLF